MNISEMCMETTNNVVHYQTGEDVLPMGGGPSTWEEALADIEESEQDIDAGRGTSWNVVKQLLRPASY